MTTEGMPMHVFAHAALGRENGKVRVTLDPGTGSAPDASLTLEEAAAPALTGAWAECWPDFRSFLAYCVPQDRAMSSQPLRGRVSRQEIDLGDPARCLRSAYRRGFLARGRCDCSRGDAALFSWCPR